MAELLLTQEVSDLIRVPVETLRGWRSAGKGPQSFKVGRRVVYDREDLNAWLAGQRAAATRQR